jgi:sulfide:quinone oxidoreductase
MVVMALEIRPLVDGIAVAPQIDLADIAAIQAAGYRTIINNRPDGEEAGQPTAADAGQFARSLGLVYIHQPVVGATLGHASAAAFAEAIAASPGPVLAHCRSGTRSTILWSLAEAKAGKLSIDEIFRVAASAGYDITGHRVMLDQAAQKSG